MSFDREKARDRRKLRIRYAITGLSGRPRLCVFRSLKHISAQIVDDAKGVTVVAASTQEGQCRKEGVHSNLAGAKRVGELIAQRAKEKSVKKVVFDRGGYLYHGRIKALADAARAGGLEF